MIPYSLNGQARINVTVGLVLVSVVLTGILDNIIMQYLIDFELKSNIMSNIYSEKAFELLIAVTIPPFIVWYLLHALYSKILWKCSFFLGIHHIPDLNGTWDGYTYNAQNPSKKRSVTVTIKQDWNSILIKTKMNDTSKDASIQSFCECTVAAIDITNGVAKLKYAYTNILLGTESYVGYNELKIEGKQISGQYITTKPTNGIFDITKK